MGPSLRSSAFTFSIWAWSCSWRIGFLYHSNQIALHCYLILLACSRDYLLSFGRSGHAGNSERQDPQAGSDRRHADQPRRASLFREVSGGHRSRRFAAAQICGDQEEQQRSMGPEYVFASAVLLLRRHEPALKLFL